MEKTKESPNKYICSNPNVLPGCENRQANRCHYKGSCHLKEDFLIYQQRISTVGGEYEFCKLVSIVKSNQKQYKEFLPESFKAYIDKFNMEDKLRAYKILSEIINIELL